MGTEAVVDPAAAGEPLVDDRREVNGWSMYAWANHAWATTVGAVLIGPWLLALATSAVGSGHATLLSIGPWHLSADAYPSLAVAAAAILQLLLLPILGASADGLAGKRLWLAGACGIGSLVTVALATTGGRAWLYAGLLFLAGTVVFGLSDLVYNAFLPEIASPGRREATSGRGYAFGYLGGGLLLAVNLVLLEAHGAIGLSKAGAVRLAYVVSGLWWAGFGAFAISRLRSRPRSGQSQGATPAGSPGGWRGLAEGLRLLRSMPQTLRFLVAYLLFADAISAVISLASVYITHQLFHDDAAKAAPFLFALILLIQFIAMGGSLVTTWAAGRVGTKPTMLATLVVWCGVIVYAYADLHTTTQAVVMGVVIGVVLGGTLTLARSAFSDMVPRGREATFFGIYEVSNHGTSWIAPLLFTVVVNATGSFRQAILSLIVLFVAGALLLAATDVEAARTEAAGPAAGPSPAA
ncbi:MAG: MFS transporter [Acidimicrobiales bacterium]